MQQNKGKEFSMLSAPSNSRTTGLCTPFLGNVSANTFPHALQCGDVSNNVTVFSMQSMPRLYNAVCELLFQSELELGVEKSTRSQPVKTSRVI
jgi:hypothetical protein